MNYNEIIYKHTKDYEDISKCNFYELAIAFEYYSAIMLSKEYNRKIYHYNDLDIIYKEQNNLSKKDTGIDLCDKQDIIGQVKLRSNALNWTELSTFVAQINQYDHTTKKRFIKWQEPILIRNSCSKVSPNLQEHLNFNICIDKPLHLEDFYNYCNNLKVNPPIIENTNDIIEARDYQIEAINLIKDNPNKNIYLCLPTGSGKTYVFIMSIEPNKKYIILVPFIILLEQWNKEIIKLKPELKQYIQCLGDGNNTFNNDKLITITTYNSVELVGNLQDYDRVVTDEAHRIVKPEIYEEIYEEIEEDDTNYTTIINNNINQNNNNILLSATLDNSYNDNDLYHKVELRNLINQGVLTDYQIKIPIFEDNANDISVCQYIVKNYTSMIIYSSSHKQGKKITETLNKISKNCAYYIDCNTPKKERKDIIRDFKKGKIKFLVNVRILIEGFNAKICNGVILYHISKNDKTIIQIVGRALRKYRNKLYAYIVLPFINSEDSKDLQFILRVLANNDSEIKQRCIDKKLGGYIDIEKINEDEADEALLETKIELVFDSLGKCIKGSIELMIMNLDKISQFIDNNKRTPSINIEDEKKLAKIYFNYRKSYKNNKGTIEFRNKWEILLKDEKYVKYLSDDIYYMIYMMQKYEEYVIKKKERPLLINSKLLKGKVLTEDEKKSLELAKWYSKKKEQKLKRNDGKNTLFDNNPDLLKMFNEMEERLDEYINPLTIKETKIIELFKWIHYNERKPREKIFKDGNQILDDNLVEDEKYEIKQGKLYSDMKRCYITNKSHLKNKDIRELWEKNTEKYKEYLNDIDYKNKEHIELLISASKWIDDNKKKPREIIYRQGKVPNDKLTDDEKDEIKYGRFLQKTKGYYKKNQSYMKKDNIEIIKKYENFCENYKEYL